MADENRRIRQGWLMGGAALVIGFAALLSLPLPVAVLGSCLAATLCGVLSAKATARPLQLLWLMVGAGILIEVCWSLSSPMTYKNNPSMMLGATVPCVMWMGGELARPAANDRFRLPTILLLGLLVPFAQSSFNAISLLDAGLLGYVLFYGCMGTVLYRRGHALWSVLIVVAPFAVISAAEMAVDFGYMLYFRRFGLPLIALAASVAGYLAGRPGIMSKVPISAIAISMALLVAFWVPGGVEQYSWEEPLQPRPVVPFHLVGLDGDSLTEQQLVGKVTWMEFYTTRCGPCFRQMACVERVQQQFVANEAVLFVSVGSAYFEPKDRFTGATKVHSYPMWHGYEADSALAATYSPVGVPTGLLIDRQGVVRYIKHGFSEHDGDYFETRLARLIEDLLGES